MVVPGDKLFFYSCFVYLSSLAAGGLLENVITELDPCEDVCQKTYSLHTYDKSTPGSCCSRGCRLYSILELIGGDGGHNGTLQSCFDNCKDAYPTNAEETSACVLGCSSQRPFAEKWPQEPSLLPDAMPHMMYPLMYMHSLYSSIVSKATQHMAISLSFFMQDGSGRLVIIKSQPPVTDLDMQGLRELAASMGTSSVMETNLEPADKTATEILTHSQLKSMKSAGHEVNAAETSPWTHKLDTDGSTDWLACIAKKSGVPRLLLTIFILLSAVALIWLSLSAAVTAPEHRLTQKLRTNSSLDYLISLRGKKLIKGILPQHVVEARPLPLKLSMQQV